MIQDLSKSKQSLISSLSQRKIRQRLGLYVVEGTKSVSELVNSDKLVMLVATNDWQLSHDQICKMANDKLFTAQYSQMCKISSLSTAPDVLAVLKMDSIHKSSEEIEINHDDLYLVLDEIQDPGNLGTIIRTADWFGIKTVLISEGSADIYNPKTLQSTMGSLSRVTVVYCDIKDLLHRHKGMPVYGTLLDGKNIYDVSLKQHGFIIMGNEGRGIRNEIRSLITDAVMIPPYDNASHPESLNVAVTTGIILSIFRNI